MIKKNGKSDKKLKCRIKRTLLLIKELLIYYPSNNYLELK